MPQPLPIQRPARYVAPFAVGFSDASGALALVAPDRPLPVTAVEFANPPAATLSGEADAAMLAGPFTAAPGRPIHLQLGGTWQGTVALQRSTDGGATRHQLTAGGQPWAVFAGNANEPVWQESEDGVSFWLDIALGSGTLSWRLSQ